MDPGDAGSESSGSFQVTEATSADLEAFARRQIPELHVEFEEFEAVGDIHPANPVQEGGNISVSRDRSPALSGTKSPQLIAYRKETADSDKQPKRAYVEDESEAEEDDNGPRRQSGNGAGRSKDKTAATEGPPAQTLVRFGETPERSRSRSRSPHRPTMERYDTRDRNLEERHRRIWRDGDDSRDDRYGSGRYHSRSYREEYEYERPRSRRYTPRDQRRYSVRFDSGDSLPSRRRRRRYSLQRPRLARERRRQRSYSPSSSGEPRYLSSQGSQSPAYYSDDSEVDVPEYKAGRTRATRVAHRRTRSPYYSDDAFEHAYPSPPYYGARLRQRSIDSSHTLSPGYNPYTPYSGEEYYRYRRYSPPPPRRMSYYSSPSPQPRARSYYSSPPPPSPPYSGHPQPLFSPESRFVVKVPLDTKVEENHGLPHGILPVAPAWSNSNHTIGQGVSTELLAINVAENFTDEKYQSKITLYCPLDQQETLKNPQRHYDTEFYETPSRQIYWLHVRHSFNTQKVLRDMVVKCPHVTNEVKSVALRLLKDEWSRIDIPDAQSAGDTDAPRVLRYDGEFEDEPSERRSVTYVSTPFLYLREPRGKEMGDTQSLLKFHYGYQIGERRNNEQVIRQSQYGLAKEIVNVSRLQCLLLGPQVIITCAEVPMSALLSDNIVINMGESRPPFTIRVRSWVHNTKDYYLVLQHDVSYAEALIRIKNMTGLSEFDVYETASSLSPLTPEDWLRLMGSYEADPKLHTEIELILDQRVNRRVRRYNEYHDIHPSARSRRSISRYRTGPYTSDLVDYGMRGAAYRSSHSVAERYGVSRAPNNGESWVLTRRASRRYSDEGPSSRSLILRPRSRHMRYSGDDRARYAAGPVVLRSRGDRGRSHDEPSKKERARSRSKEAERRIIYSEPEEYFSGPRRVETIESRSRDLEAESTLYDGKPQPPGTDANRTEVEDEVESIVRSFEIPGQAPMNVRHRSIRPRPKKREENFAFSTDNSSESEASFVRRRPGAGAQRGSTNAWRDSITSDQEVPKPPSVPRTQRNQEETSSSKEETDDLNTPLIPFLTWKVTQSSLAGAGPHGSITVVVALLANIGANLAKDPTNGTVYSSTYESSLEEVQRRYDTLEQSQSTPTDGDDKASGSLAKKPGSLDKDFKTGSFDSHFGEDHLGHHKDENGGTVLVHVVVQADQMIRDIFDLSQQLMNTFVPLNGAIMGKGREVLYRYWGALDVIFRHLRYAAQSDVGGDDEQLWKIRAAARKSAIQRGLSGACRECDKKRRYSLAAALEHLHSTHLPHLNHAQYRNKPYDDPCIALLEAAKPSQRGERFTTMLDTLKDFKSDLSEILTRVIELQLFVARPTTTQEDGASDMSDLIKKPEPPTLSSGLLKAFESLIMAHVIQARIFRLTTRGDEGRRGNSMQTKIGKGSELYYLTLGRLNDHLDDARNELVLSITAASASAVTLGAVGPEYLLAMVVANAQTGAIRAMHGESPQKTRKQKKEPELGSVRKRHTEKTDASWESGQHNQNQGASVLVKADTEMPSVVDLTEVYQAHMLDLEFSASQKPQRRVFLAIRSLEEELAALRHVSNSKELTLCGLDEILDPRTFRHVDAFRHTMWRMEHGLLGKAYFAHRRDNDAMGKLEDRAEALRLRVKEGIEVLDEGHGKAIRVFTLVTLFFLPLSFVTSFFGMNTSDIRDMSGKQWLYWSIATPVTVVVLGTAYMYAYKWESMSLWTSRTWKSKVFGHRGNSPSIQGAVRDSRLGRMTSRGRGVAWRLGPEGRRQNRREARTRRYNGGAYISQNGTWGSGTGRTGRDYVVSKSRASGLSSPAARDPGRSTPQAMVVVPPRPRAPIRDGVQPLQPERAGPLWTGMTELTSRPKSKQIPRYPDEHRTMLVWIVVALQA